MAEISTISGMIEIMWFLTPPSLMRFPLSKISQVWYCFNRNFIRKLILQSLYPQVAWFSDCWSKFKFCVVFTTSPSPSRKAYRWLVLMFTDTDTLVNIFQQKSGRYHFFVSKNVNLHSTFLFKRFNFFVKYNPIVDSLDLLKFDH